jgi:hypothetical protein
MSENYRAPGLGNANTEVVQEKRMECKKRERGGELISCRIGLHYNLSIFQQEAWNDIIP